MQLGPWAFWTLKSCITWTYWQTLIIAEYKKQEQENDDPSDGATMQWRYACQHKQKEVKGWARQMEIVETIMSWSDEEGFPGPRILHREVRGVKFKITTIINTKFRHRNKIKRFRSVNEEVEVERDESPKFWIGRPVLSPTRIVSPPVYCSDKGFKLAMSFVM